MASGSTAMLRRAVQPHALLDFTCSSEASAEHFQQCAEFLLLRNRSLGPLTRFPPRDYRRSGAFSRDRLDRDEASYRRERSARRSRRSPPRPIANDAIDSNILAVLIGAQSGFSSWAEVSIDRPGSVARLRSSVTKCCSTLCLLMARSGSSMRADECLFLGGKRSCSRHHRND